MPGYMAAHEMGGRNKRREKKGRGKRREEAKKGKGVKKGRGKREEGKKREQEKKKGLPTALHFKHLGNPWRSAQGWQLGHKRKSDSTGPTTPLPRVSWCPMVTLGPCKATSVVTGLGAGDPLPRQSRHRVCTATAGKGRAGGPW